MYLLFYHHTYQYLLLTTNIFKYAIRLYGFQKTKPPCRGISGRDKDKDPILYQQHGAKLFSTIVRNSAGVAYKKELKVSGAFINMKTRGKAVAIGPLEYCGNGIPLR